MTAAARFMRAPEPTASELRAVWQSMPRRNWPPTFEEAMADPTLSRLVRLTALHPPRAVRKVMTSSAPAPRCATPYPRRPAMEACFDRKRAAAGDRDD